IVHEDHKAPIVAVNVWYIKCSKRCANPVLPGLSFFEPTWYHTFTATMGALWSSWTMSVSPLSSVNSLKGMSTSCAKRPHAASAQTKVSTAARNRIGKPPIEWHGANADYSDPERSWLDCRLWFLAREFVPAAGRG